MKKGFTLFEIIIAITVFSIIISAFLGIFGSTFNSQKKSLNTAYLLSSISYVTEYVSRDLRMAQKDVLGNCISNNDNFQVTHSGQGLKFLNYQGECHEIYVQDNVLIISRDGIAETLTPSDITVEDMNFYVTGEQGSDMLQPKASFFMHMKTITEPVQELRFQTTVSQRPLDL